MYQCYLLSEILTFYSKFCEGHIFLVLYSFEIQELRVKEIVIIIIAVIYVSLCEFESDLILYSNSGRDYCSHFTDKNWD